MSLSEILEIAISIMTCITCGLLIFTKVKGDVSGAIAELIALAESSGMCGKDKMAMVVSRLYEKVPTVFKKILTAEVLETMAQFVFDSMRKYAEEYKKNKEQGETTENAADNK